MFGRRVSEEIDNTSKSWKQRAVSFKKGYMREKAKREAAAVDTSVLESTEFPSIWCTLPSGLLVLQKGRSTEKPGSHTCSSSAPRSTVLAKASFALKTAIGKWKEHSCHICCWLQRTVGLLCAAARQGQPQ